MTRTLGITLFEKAVDSFEADRIARNLARDDRDAEFITSLREVAEALRADRQK